MSMSQMKAQLIASNHCRRYNISGIQRELEGVLLKRGENNKYIYKTIYQNKAKSFKAKKSGFIVELHADKHRDLLDNMPKKLFVKLLNRRSVKSDLNSVYNDDIYIKIMVIC